MATHRQYRTAAGILWGDAGTFAVDSYQRLNVELFAGKLPPLPIVIGLAAYGKCLGITRGRGQWHDELPRITLAPEIFQGSGPDSGRMKGGRNVVTDVILHEMIHAKLILAGLDSSHNGKPWCEELERLSPLVLGRAVNAKPIHPRKVDGRSVRRNLDGYLTRVQIATWPNSLRENGYASGDPIRVATY